MEEQYGKLLFSVFSIPHWALCERRTDNRRGDGNLCASMHVQCAVC